MNIRPCRHDECATVLDLWRKAEVVPSKTDTLEYLNRLVGENKDLFLVAEENGRIVGTIIGGWDGWRGYIYRLAVLPEYRRQGIGKALVLEVEKRISEKGASRISLMVERNEILAKTFWDSLQDVGYEQDNRIIRYVKTM